MTEHDHTHPDEARRPAAGDDRATTERISGGAGSDDGGRTRVIHTTSRPDGASPGVHIPPQGGPADRPVPAYGTPTNVAPAGYGAPAQPTRGYGPGDAYGSPTVAPPAAPGYGAGQGYGTPAYGAPGQGTPVQGTPGQGAPQGYGATPGYGGAQGYGTPQGYGAAPGYGGQPYGATPAYAGAPAYGAAPPGAGLPSPGYGAPASNGPLGPPPPGYGPPATGGGRTKKTIIIALVAVVVLLAGGIGGYFYLRGGGAASPTAATRLMADDLQGGDLGGAVRVLHPDEAALAGDLGSMFRDELVRLQVLRSDAPRDVLLTGTTFTGLQFDDTAVEQVRPDVAITKLVAGTITVNRDPNALPLTDSYKKIAYPDGVPTEAPKVIDIAKVVAEQGHPVRIATVQVDGAWYVSLTYSVADAALLEQHESWPQGTVAPRGSASAEDAVRDEVTALVGQDAQRLVEMAPPHELAVVHDVGPLLVQKGGSSRSTARLVDIATTSELVDGGTAVTINRLVVAENGGEQVTVTRDGDCLSVTTTGGYSGGSPTRVCAQDVANEGVGAVPGMSDPALRDVLVRAARAAIGLRVVVVEDGGQYYVSPIRTVAGLGIDVLRTLQPADLARLADATRNR